MATDTKNATTSTQPRAPKPDLTMLRDPIAIWPDAQDCPDYPLQIAGYQHKSALTRAEAEGQLRHFSGILNGEGPLRVPSEAERADAIERYFKPEARGVRIPGQEGFDARGFRGLVGAPGNKHADLMAKAVHLRGYLRKLAEREERAKQNARDRKDNGARHKLDEYAAHLEGLEVRAKALAEGAARYRQHVADKGSFYQLLTMRSELSKVQAEASAAAQELGEAAPLLPNWIDDLCKDA